MVYRYKVLFCYHTASVLRTHLRELHLLIQLCVTLICIYSSNGCYNVDTDSIMLFSFECT